LVKIRDYQHAFLLLFCYIVIKKEFNKEEELNLRKNIFLKAKKAVKPTEI